MRASVRLVQPWSITGQPSPRQTAKHHFARQLLHCKSGQAFRQTERWQARAEVLNAITALDNLMNPEVATIFTAMIAVGSVCINLYGRVLAEEKKSALRREIEMEKLVLQKQSELRSMLARYRGPLLESAVELEQRIYHMITRTGEWASVELACEEDIMYTLFTFAQLLGFIEVVRRESPREQTFLLSANPQGTDALTAWVEAVRFVLCAHASSLQAWYAEPPVVRSHPGARSRTPLQPARSHAHDSTTALSNEEDLSSHSSRGTFSNYGSSSNNDARNHSYDIDNGSSISNGSGGSSAYGSTSNQGSSSDLVHAHGSSSSSNGSSSRDSDVNRGYSPSNNHGSSSDRRIGSVVPNIIGRSSNSNNNITVNMRVQTVEDDNSKSSQSTEALQAEVTVEFSNTVDVSVHSEDSTTAPSIPYQSSTSSNCNVSACNGTSGHSVCSEPNVVQTLSWRKTNIMGRQIFAKHRFDDRGQSSIPTAPSSSRECRSSCSICDAFRISRGMQRAIGSMMIVTPNGAGRQYTASYAHFYERFQTDELFAGWFMTLYQDCINHLSGPAFSNQQPFPINSYTRLLLLQQLLIEAMELLDPFYVRVQKNRRVVISPVEYATLPNIDAIRNLETAAAQLPGAMDSIFGSFDTIEQPSGNDQSNTNQQLGPWGQQITPPWKTQQTPSTVLTPQGGNNRSVTVQPTRPT